VNTRELAAHLGVPERTLRYRLRALDGLVVGVEVDGVRQYSPQECDTVARACGLFEEGRRSAAEVRRMLQGHGKPESTLPAVPTQSMASRIAEDLAAIRTALEAIAASIGSRQPDAVPVTEPNCAPPNAKAAAALVRFARRSGVLWPRSRRSRR
jgi:DNA-binding transcriptional MerR regulator